MAAACKEKGAKQATVEQEVTKSPRQSAQEDLPWSLEVVGHGIAFTPILPRGIAHLADGTLILGPMGNAGDAKVSNVLVKPGRSPTRELTQQTTEEGIVRFSSGEDGSTAIALGAGMDSYGGLISQVRSGAPAGDWKLVTLDHSISWPKGLTLRVDGDEAVDSYEYEFTVGNSSEDILYLRGPLAPRSAESGSPSPLDIPHLDELVLDWQTEVGRGQLQGSQGAVPWLEIRYAHGGDDWRARFYWLALDTDRVYLLRAQARESLATMMLASADQIAASFRPIH